VAVNLAAIFALSGKRVALVDADLRRPCVHRTMGLPNRDGLSNLFRNQADVQSVSRSKLELPSLMVITSGSLPPNPAELLGSQRMSQILEELCGQVDVVVIDSPPSLVADAQILAGKVDAVLFVIQPGVTHAETAKASFGLFQRTGARVIGAVLNRIPRSRSYYYGGYKYYSQYGKGRGYYAATAEPEQKIERASAPPTIDSPAAYSLLSKAPRLSQGSEELPPPDVPRK
jgi:capsular exopolysaccharide synthesis family protein